MSPQVTQTAQPTVDSADARSQVAFMEQGLLPYDQAKELPEPDTTTEDQAAADKADEQRFMDEFLNETGYFGEGSAEKLTATVDTGRTALAASEVVINYVPTETAVPVLVGAGSAAA